MKPAGLIAYEGIKNELPGLTYQTLLVIDARVYTTQDEAHEIVSTWRPKTAYSSVRSRFWDLEVMGLIMADGVRRIKLGNGKERVVTRYRTTPTGEAVAGLAPLKAEDILTDACKVITKGKESRVAATRIISDKYNEMMRGRARAKIHYGLKS